jgi:hypothetical protein
MLLEKTCISLEFLKQFMKSFCRSQSAHRRPRFFSRAFCISRYDLYFKTHFAYLLLLGATILSPLAAQAIVKCANQPSDVASIQSAVNAGGSVTINGTCAIGGTTVYINNAVVINGPATINGNQSQVFSVNANNFTINALTIQYGCEHPGCRQTYNCCHGGRCVRCKTERSSPSLTP